MKHPELEHIGEEMMQKKSAFISLATKHGTPYYAFDREAVRSALKRFQSIFKKYIPSIQSYYAVKTNHHPFMLDEVHKQGLGADVSSPRELKMVLERGFTDIVYTGPGKTEEGLSLVIKYPDTITLLIDSFSELEKIGTLTKRYKKTVKAGVRIYTKQQLSWAKFGIPLKQLADFWKEAHQYPYLKLEGIQFHNSWNADSVPYEDSIRDIARYIKTNTDVSMRKQIRFIDFGGGFRPHNSEGYYKDVGNPETYTLTPSVSLETYAQGIGTAITTYLNPLVSCAYYTEPGRILSNQAMHIVMQVVDKKSDNVIIVDGGINSVGWERFEYEYFPVINLTHPSKQEISCQIYGNLCMPQDQWGYSVFASKIEEGDILVVPYQGTLTYSLAQEFIFPIPPVYTFS